MPIGRALRASRAGNALTPGNVVRGNAQGRRMIVCLSRRSVKRYVAANNAAGRPLAELALRAGHFHNVEIRFIHKDVAVALVGWTQLGDPRFQDKPRQGTFTFVVGRKGDMWVIDAAHNTQRPYGQRRRPQANAERYQNSKDPTTEAAG
jgi:hypothetical protein